MEAPVEAAFPQVGERLRAALDQRNRDSKIANIASGTFYRGAPGLMESEGVKNNPAFDLAKAPMIASRSIKRAMVPEDLLGALLFLTTSGSDCVTGQTLNVDGGRFNT